MKPYLIISTVIILINILLDFKLKTGVFENRFRLIIFIIICFIAGFIWDHIAIIRGHWFVKGVRLAIVEFEVYYFRMPRKPRLHFPGAFYHVLLRGNDGQKIFFDEEDRYRLYLLLQEGICRYGHRVHAFCFMGNHLHFVLQVADVPLSRIVQNFSFRFTRWINRKQGRVGHLFHSR